MPTIEYIPKKFMASSLQVIDDANKIIDEYMKAGYILTLRQLYYQFVSRDLIPNNQKQYDRLGAIIGDARLAGLIDWNALEDRGRNLTVGATWDGPADIVSACASQFRLDLWANQKNHVEVWVEKEALLGVVNRTCSALRVGAFACKGYVSLSEMWDAGYNRLRGHVSSGKRVKIIHLGDHDPSGIDMTRDIGDRLRMLAMTKHIDIDRIALNFNQIQQYNPPPNPAKSTDSRFASYEAQYGNESWELDALPPNVLDTLIRDAVAKYRDDKRFNSIKKLEQKARDTLSEVANRWDDVEDFVT